jgi:hypothetical protein
MPPDPVDLAAGCLDAVEKPICRAMVEGSSQITKKLDLRI